MLNQRWHIFCKIVDNFGDIGVCWRLAKQLRAEHGLHISLWIDDFASAKKIIPSLYLAKNQQVCDEITLLKWDETADFSEAAQVVIEAFSCELPPAYLAAMAQRQSKWINLEYLSAEPWIDDFHGKPSPKPEHKLTRHFYFPGFTEKTGGLIRESAIAAQLQNHLDTSFPRMTEGEGLDDVLKISLFCYPDAPVHNLFTALQANKNKVIVYVPVSGILPKIADFFGQQSIEIGQQLTSNNLTVQVLPFLPQQSYDQLLRDCDLNFVRGEDSWIRAIWAAKPFIWLPYFQEENTHIVKLNAFLNRFYAQYEQKQVVCEAHRYWVAGHASPADFIAIWQQYLNQLKSLQVHTQLQAVNLAKQPDLASQLVDFCNLKSL